MMLETFLTAKPPIACTTTLGPIFSTGLRSCIQGVSFVKFVYIV